MTKWTPELEASIRAVGEYNEKQMKELLNPKTPVPVSALRIAFGSIKGTSVMKKACKEAGWEFKYSWMSNLKQLVALAEQNGSDAADKIKKTLPTAEKLSELYRPGESDEARQKESVRGILNQVKAAKKSGFKY